MGKQTNRQAGRQTDRQAGRQTDNQVDRQTDKQVDRQTDRQTGRQVDRQTNKQTDKTDRQRQTDKNKQTNNKQADKHKWFWSKQQIHKINHSKRSTSPHGKRENFHLGFDSAILLKIPSHCGFPKYVFCFKPVITSSPSSLSRIIMFRAWK